jgi:hypothetical protein
MDKFVAVFRNCIQDHNIKTPCALEVLEVSDENIAVVRESSRRDDWPFIKR